MSPAYDIESWHDLLVATVGAAAGLTGLLFVALSINIDQVLAFPRLPGRAALTLGILSILLIVGILGLAPGQSDGLLGAEFAALGLLAATAALWVSVHPRPDPADPIAWTLWPLTLILVPSIALMLGGVTLAIGVGGGLYWILVGIVLGFVASVINAWVMLVEIKR